MEELIEKLELQGCVSLIKNVSSEMKIQLMDSLDNFARIEDLAMIKFDAERELDEFLHTENFVLIDKNRHIRGIYNGLSKASVNQLIADIRTLKKEDG